MRAASVAEMRSTGPSIAEAPTSVSLLTEHVLRRILSVHAANGEEEANCSAYDNSSCRAKNATGTEHDSIHGWDHESSCATHDSNCESPESEEQEQMLALLATDNYAGLAPLYIKNERYILINMDRSLFQVLNCQGVVAQVPVDHEKLLSAVMEHQLSQDRGVSATGLFQQKLGFRLSALIH